MPTVFLTHTPDMLANYYGERALAALRELAPVKLNETAKVLDAPGGSEVTWEVTVEPAEAEGMFRDIYQGALDALKAKLEG